MSSRFRRDYKLIVGIGSQQVEIVPPFNIKFTATENTEDSSLNKLQIVIPGLKESTRLKLIKYEKDKTTHLPVEFYIGYQDGINRIFKGSVKTGTPSKEGAVHNITLDCYDGYPDFNMSFTSATVTSTEVGITQLIGDMDNTEKGTITALDNMLRPQVLVGPTSKLLKEMAGGRELYIKDEKVYVLNSNEVLSSIAPIVTAQTGLKSAPQENHEDVTFTTMFNPAVKLGHLSNLESKLNPSSNGLLRVTQIVTNGEYESVWEQVVTGKKQNDYTVVR